MVFEGVSAMYGTGTSARGMREMQDITMGEDKERASVEVGAAIVVGTDGKKGPPGRVMAPRETPITVGDFISICNNHAVRCILRKPW